MPALRYVAAADQVSCELSGEAALLQLGTGTYYTVNPTGARLWRMLREPRTVRELRDELLSHGAADPERAEHDVQLFLGRLESAGLVSQESCG